MREEAYLAALQQVKIPIVVLDQKWHRLFAISGKPDEIISLEVRLKDLLAEQGKYTQTLKDLKKLKNNLMQTIVQNMEGAESDATKVAETQKLDENKRLIEETNQKIAECEDQLLDLPKEIKAVNEMLMIETMKFSYGKLRTNTSEIDEISAWIKQMRVDLKKNIIKKQNREINNKEIYAYMHDIFGKDVIDLFDVKYED